MALDGSMGMITAMCALPGDQVAVGFESGAVALVDANKRFITTVFTSVHSEPGALFCYSR
jgi:hypothetical protein